MNEDKIKFWTVLCSIILAVSVLVMLIDMSIKAAILEESGHLRRVILGEREQAKQPGDSTGNPEYNFHSGVPSDLLVPTDSGMGEASSDNGYKAPTSARRKTRQVLPRDPEIPPRDE